MKPNFNLLLAIRRRGWRQQDFAKAVGDHPTFVSRVVNGWINLSLEQQINTHKFWTSAAMSCSPSKHKIDPVYLDLAGASAYVGGGLSVKTLRRLIANGRLPAFRPGGNRAAKL
jgi:hypothetical protein